MLIFKHHDASQGDFVPQREGGGFLVVDPQWLRNRERDRVSRVHSDDVLFDHLKRGFHVWMVSATTSTARKLVPPEEVSVHFSR